MAEDWELRSLERRVEALEKNEERRRERLNWWASHLYWMSLSVILTTVIVLAATGHLHHN